MKKSAVLFLMLLVISSCTNYPAKDDVNRELIPEPDKALREEYEKHQKELKEGSKQLPANDTTSENQ